MGLPLWALGQENCPMPSPLNLTLKPIVVQDSTLFGLTYSLNDEMLLNQKDFEDIIFPLNDFESIRLLKRSASSGSVAGIFHLIGIGGVLTGLTGILASPNNRQIPYWITAIGGGITFEISGFFQSEAGTARFNAVQRYNRFARGEMQVLPQTPKDEKSLLKFDEPIKTSIPANNKISRNKVDHP